MNVTHMLTQSSLTYCLFSLWWPIYLSLPRVCRWNSGRPFVAVASIVENVDGGDYLLLLGWSFWVGSQVYSCSGYISTKTIQRPSWTWLERRSLLGSRCEPLVSRIAAVSYTFTKENPPESLYGDVSRSCVIYRVKSSIEVWHIAN